MVATVTERVEKRRSKLRMAGLRPVQIWVPDTRRPDFAAECKRQSKLTAPADKADEDLASLMDEVLFDIDGWVE